MSEFLFCNQQAIGTFCIVSVLLLFFIFFCPLKKFQVFNKFLSWVKFDFYKQKLSCVVPHEVACMGSYFALNKSFLLYVCHSLHFIFGALG
jgi:hypothetical protein